MKKTYLQPTMTMVVLAPQHMMAVSSGIVFDDDKNTGSGGLNDDYGDEDDALSKGRGGFDLW